jgi:hypothetical protein
MRGVRIFSGDTQWGKTTLAERHALEANDAGQAFLILDRMPATNWIGKPHAPSKEDVLKLLYGKPSANVIYSPKSKDEVEWLLKKVHEGGTLGEPRTVLWDECSLDMSPLSIGDEASQALRGWAHSNNLYLMVTQRFHELHGVIYVCSPSIRVFHTEHVKSLDRIQAELRLDVEKIRAQEKGEFEIYGRDQ